MPDPKPLTSHDDFRAAIKACDEADPQPAYDPRMGPTTNGKRTFEVGLTPNGLKAAGKGVLVVCGRCSAKRRLDLAALIRANKGSVDLEEAWDRGKFTCQGCGSHRCTLHLDG